MQNIQHKCLFLLCVSPAVGWYIISYISESEWKQQINNTRTDTAFWKALKK